MLQNMIRYSLLLILCSLFFKSAIAQKAPNAFYLTNAGLLTSKDSADYILMIVPPAKSISGALYTIKKFYPDGKRMAITTATNNSIPLRLQGAYISFFPNGRQMTVRNYEKGEIVGDEYNYYPNGMLYNSKSYINVKKQHLNLCKDSTGKVLAENGNGRWVEFDKAFKSHAEGKVINGLKEGEWSGKLNDTTEFAALFKNGKVISSKFADRSGTEHIFKFNEVDVVPEYRGGMSAYNTSISPYLIAGMAYRLGRKETTVAVSYVIKKDGSISDIKVLKGMGSGFDDDYVKAIRLATDWLPGYQFGVPVNVEFTPHPITFEVGVNSNKFAF